MRRDVRRGGSFACDVGFVVSRRLRRLRASERGSRHGADFARGERAERGHRRRGATWDARLIAPLCVGTRVCLVRGCGCGCKMKSRHRARHRGACRPFVLWLAERPDTNTTHRPTSEAIQTPDPRRSSPPMPALRSLIARGDEKQNRLRVMRRAQKRAGGADDATRRNRRRTRTTHLAGHPDASNGALIRLRQVENQSAPLPCLLSFHTDAEWFTVSTAFLFRQNFGGSF